MTKKSEVALIVKHYYKETCKGIVGWRQLVKFVADNKVSISLLSQLLPSYAVEATSYFSVVKSTVVLDFIFNR